MGMLYDWRTDPEWIELTETYSPAHRAVARVIAALLFVAVSGVAGYVAASMWTAGQAPVIRERKVFVPVVETIDQPGSTAAVQPAERLQTHRLVLVGDSSLSLWQNEMAAHVATSGQWHGYKITEVVPVAEEGKLPCYFHRYKPVEIRPGDIVAVSFVLTQWHRTESDSCRNSVAASTFYDMFEAFARYVASAGGTVVPLALPDGSPGTTAFTGEPWFPGMSPDEIEAWSSDRFEPIVGEICRDQTVLDTDLFHVAPAGKDTLGACMAAVQ
jgi:hypothetical protein